MTVELSKYEILLIIKSLTTSQPSKEDELFAFLLTNRLKTIVEK
jgi:hypothetical protein